MGTSFFSSIGMTAPSSSPAIPPNTILAHDIRVPPILPKKPRLHEKHGLHWDANSGETWLYRMIGSKHTPPHSCSSLQVASSVGLAPDVLSENCDNGVSTCPDSTSLQDDNRSWNPIVTLESDGLNDLFISEAPTPAKQPKSRGSASCGVLAQQWNELIPRLIVPFSRQVAGTNWDSGLSFDAGLPPCNGNAGYSPRTLHVTCIRTQSASS
ncbi:hypothetical protein BS47DRAFT_1489485 [Hydnum rufescens UP504]|uniref:Uncharacterized protein n=1 Tax=Hydnum rufescens UP504 TaxID=1448309 RepID=A0A9P6AHZ6_9AGAM|nr:hypothetical protein BS47DRAFT_1489485 [Hydnum rufescens UP504]